MGITALVGQVHGSLLLHHQHDHHDRSGDGHRLLALRRLPLPRGEGGRPAARSTLSAGPAPPPAARCSSARWPSSWRWAACSWCRRPCSTAWPWARSSPSSPACSAALTLLPALLGAMGDKVNALRVPFLRKTADGAGRPGGFWDRLSHGVMRRPVTSLVLAAGRARRVIAGLYFSIDLGSAGVDTLPASMESRQGFEVLQERVPGSVHGAGRRGHQPATPHSAGGAAGRRPAARHPGRGPGVRGRRRHARRAPAAN